MGFLNIAGLGKVHYHEYGNGVKPMLAFHGYSMTGKQFHVMERSLLDDYRIYGFDHFFHGKSELDNWPEEKITAGMPVHFVAGYLTEWFKIHGEQRVSLLAYSIGANLALLLVELFPGMIDEVILMAPDGLAVHKGFNFLANKPAGRLLFRAATKSKWLAPFILKTIRKMNVIDDSLYHIAYNEVDTLKKRNDVYYTLSLIRLLRPNPAKVAALINERNIRCVIIFGKYDMLYPGSAAQPFVELLDNPKVHTVNQGHWLVTKELDHYLANIPQ